MGQRTDRTLEFLLGVASFVNTEGFRLGAQESLDKGRIIHLNLFCLPQVFATRKGISVSVSKQATFSYGNSDSTHSFKN